MTDLQSKLLEMLKEIDVICRKYQITYYLIGGSALGAVRHHGFIPWDDDADIVMTRDNWLKFESIIDQEIRPDRKYMTWQRTKDYPAIFARYSNTSTTCIVNSLSYSPISWGLMIDIFVLTPIPNDEHMRKKFHSYMRLYGEMVNPFFPVSPNSSNLQYRLFRFLCKVFGKEKILNYPADKIYGYSEDDCTHYSYCYPRVHVVYDKTIFGKPRYVPFEDTVLPVPTKAEEHFKILFGEKWFLLPKNEHQISEHRMVVDLNRPYELYTGDYLTYAPRKRLDKAYAKWKAWRVRVLHQNNLRKQSMLKFDFVKDLLEWTSLWEKHGVEIEAWFAAHRYQDVSETLIPFYSLITKAEYLAHGLFIPITDRQMEILLYMLNRDGFYDLVLKLNNFMADIPQLKTPQCSALTDFAYEKSDLVFQWSCGTPPASTYIKKLLEQYPEDYTLLFLMSDSLCSSRPPELSQIQEYCMKGLSLYPEDGAFQKFYGDFLRSSQGIEQAISYYMQAQNLTRNGFLLLEIRHFLNEKEGGAK